MAAAMRISRVCPACRAGSCSHCPCYAYWTN
jgi:hypothetical protein